MQTQNGIIPIKKSYKSDYNKNKERKEADNYFLIFNNIITLIEIIVSVLFFCIKY